MGSGISADMVFLTGTTICSLYSSIHEGRQVLAENLDTDMHYQQFGMEVCAQGFGLSVDCGLFCGQSKHR